jgi:ribose/xylose/arabinose/galactoside ABC-type transport system permease subunit
VSDAQAAAARHRALPTGGARLLDRILDAGVLLSLIGLIVVFSILSPQFLTVDNLINIADASAVVGIVAVGMTVALIAGQFDLSVGSVVGLSSSLLALSMADWGVPVGLAIVIAIAAALCVGAINGALVVNFGINSIIATLGMLAAVRGIAFVVAKGSPISVDNPFLIDVGVSRPLGIPVAVYVMAVAYIGAWVLLTQFRLGVHIYAVGGDETAAERAGVRHRRVLRFVFLLASFCAAIGAILITAKSFSGQAVFGRSLELDVLTAVLLGGVGLRGGEGSIGKTLIGVAIVGVLTNGLVLTQVEAYWTDVARGGALIIAVVLEAVREKRARR